MNNTQLPNSMFTIHTQLVLHHDTLPTFRNLRQFFQADNEHCLRSLTYSKFYSIFSPNSKRPSELFLDPDTFPPPDPVHMPERFQRAAPFVFTDSDLLLLSHWHGGLHSMMYATVSTGALTPSPQWPNYTQPLADRYYQLYHDLRWELNTLIKQFPSHPDLPQITTLADKLDTYLDQILYRTSVDFNF